MKLIKKSECDFSKGYIIGADGETVIALPFPVRHQLEELDRAWQIFCYLDEQEPYHPAPTIAGFKRETFRDERAWEMPEKPETPAIEKRMEETLAYLKDVDAEEGYDKLAYACDRFHDLLDFCAEEAFIAVDAASIQALKCARVGNPLELKADDVIAMLKAMVESDVADIEVDL